MPATSVHASFDMLSTVNGLQKDHTANGPFISVPVSKPQGRFHGLVGGGCLVETLCISSYYSMQLVFELQTEKRCIDVRYVVLSKC
jgi:hypothetical protein